MTEVAIKSFVEGARIKLGLPDNPETYVTMGDSFFSSGLDDPKLGQEKLSIAMYCFKLSSEGGHSSAQSSLASGYMSGLGVGKDLKEAEFWSRKSADQDDINGMFCLGGILSINKVYEEAEYWFKKAIDGVILRHRLLWI